MLTALFKHGMAKGLGEENLSIQTCESPFKNKPCTASCLAGEVGTEHVKRVIWRDGEYTNNILRRNKFIMTA